MYTSLRRAVQRPRTRLLLTIALIALGLGLTTYFGVRTVRSFREVQYIRDQGLDDGTASVEAARVWMTIRFIAVAYAVPEEYLYSALNIPFDRRNRDASLGQLNEQYNLGFVPNGDKPPRPVIEGLVQQAITAYRLNPVATGLRDVRPWMSIRYIANSTGVPEEQIFAALKLPQEGNQSKPLALLADEQRYPGGPRALEDAVTAALATLEPGP